MWVLCGFNTIPCVISRWSPDLVFVVFVIMESDPGQCPFTLDDVFFPVAHGGRDSLIMYGQGCYQWGQKITCKRGPIWHALSTTHGGREKPWGYEWGCYIWDQESAYQRGQYHASCEWVDPLIGLCGSEVYLW